MKKLVEKQFIYLIPEKNNKFDSNAILIVDQNHNYLGYVSRDDNMKIRSLLPPNFSKPTATVNFVGSVSGNYGFNFYVNELGSTSNKFSEQSYSSKPTYQSSYYQDSNDDWESYSRSHWDEYDEDGPPYSDFPEKYGYDRD